MKVLFCNPNKMIVYLNDFKAKELNVNDKEVVEQYLKEFFIKLRNNYQLKVGGYYTLMLYHDTNYGIVIELNKEELDYYDDLDTSIDMKMIIEKNSIFLYEIEDTFFLEQQLRKESKVYRYHDKFYLQLLEKIDYIELGKLLEQSNLIYKNTIEIMKYGQVITI